MICGYLYGAMIGDIVGSIYEFSPIKTKAFPLFSESCEYTDDTIMTVAVARAIMRDHECGDGVERQSLHQLMTQEMQFLGRRYPYPMGSYGNRFALWLRADNPEPYNSYGNGSAMRASACGLAAQSLKEALELSRVSAEVSHNHPEGIKGAQATAAATFLAKTGKSKAEIKEYIEANFYSLNMSIDELNRTYGFEPSCQKSVPQAIVCFLQSDSFEDAIRNTIYIGGDSDTIGAITGSIAYAFYLRAGMQSEGNVPEEIQRIVEEAKEKLPEEFIRTAEEFEEMFFQNT